MLTLKMSEDVFKCKLRFFVILLTLTRCYDCRQLRVLEGERIELDFPHQCNSTEVTLQRGNGAPFHRSSNPDAISSSNKRVTYKQTKGDNCYLHLVIDPVSRNDVGTYILMIDNLVHTRIGVSVNYPPGKASCQLSSVHIEGVWVKLQCEAQEGTIAGQISCYQNDIRLPPLTPPRENAGSINQIILARLSDSVFCCSSLLKQTMDMCSCKDWGWNFTYNRPLTYIHPCASASTTQSPTSLQMVPDANVDITSIAITNFTTLTQPPLIPRAYHKRLLIIACFFMIVLLGTNIIWGVCTVKYKRKARKTSKVHFNGKEVEIDGV